MIDLMKAIQSKSLGAQFCGGFSEIHKGGGSFCFNPTDKLTVVFHIQDKTSFSYYSYILSISCLVKQILTFPKKNKNKNFMTICYDGLFEI